MRFSVDSRLRFALGIGAALVMVAVIAWGTWKFDHDVAETAAAVKDAPASTPTPLETGETLPTVAVVGDSYLSSWQTLAASQGDFDFDFFGEGGTGYVTGGPGLTSYGERVTLALAEEPDVLLMIGSRNDGTAEVGAVRDAFSKALAEATASQAQVIVVGPIWDATEPTTPIEEVRDAMKKVSKDAGVPFIDGLRWLTGKPELFGQEDTIHPNADGGAVLLADTLAVLNKYVA